MNHQHEYPKNQRSTRIPKTTYYGSKSLPSLKRILQITPRWLSNVPFGSHLGVIGRIHFRDGRDLITRSAEKAMAVAAEAKQSQRLLEIAR